MKIRLLPWLEINKNEELSKITVNENNQIVMLVVVLLLFMHEENSIKTCI